MDTTRLNWENRTHEVKKWNTDKKSYILDEKTQVYETMTVVTRNHEAKEAYAAAGKGFRRIQLGICSDPLSGMPANRSQLEMIETIDGVIF